MDIEFRSDKKFEKDMDKLEKKYREKVVKDINKIAKYAEMNRLDSIYKELHKVSNFSFLDDDNSSLYLYRVSNDLRIILLFDEDPLFDQVIVTLLRVVLRKDAEKTFKSIGESLYQKNINRGEE